MAECQLFLVADLGDQEAAVGQMCRVCAKKLTAPLNSIYFTFHLELVLLFDPSILFKSLHAFIPLNQPLIQLRFETSLLADLNA